MDQAWEWDSAEARKMLQKRGDSLLSSARCVRPPVVMDLDQKSNRITQRARPAVRASDSVTFRNPSA